MKKWTDEEIKKGMNLTARLLLFLHMLKMKSVMKEFGTPNLHLLRSTLTDYVVRVVDR